MCLYQVAKFDGGWIHWLIYILLMQDFKMRQKSNQGINVGEKQQEDLANKLA